VLAKEIIAVIPARYSSTRLPGKPLKNIFGKPMIYWVAKRVKSSNVEKFYVATDDERIFDECEKFSIPCIITSQDCKNGTERVAEVSEKINAKYFINVQGDEPCINISAINKLHKEIKTRKEFDFIQSVAIINNRNDLSDSSVVKVAISKKGKALYFSRLPIPFSRSQEKIQHFRCLGLYAYSQSFLSKYSSLGVSLLEEIEQIEQLRILENDYSIDTLEVEDDGLSIDTPEDLRRLNSSYFEYFQE